MQRPALLSKTAINQQLICAVLYEQGPLSRVELAERTGLHPTVLSPVCAGLLESGLVRENGATTEPAGKGRGRRRSLLAINRQELGVIGVRYTQDRVTAAIYDLTGRSRWRECWEGPFERDALCAQIAEAVALASRRRPRGLRRLLGVGLIDPGTVDHRSGRTVRSAAMPSWEDVPVVETMQQVTDLPVFLERGDGLQALGEATFGAAVGVDHVMLVTLVDGVGGGIVEGGRLLSGAIGSAGEIGHVNVNPDGPLCGCGMRGCLEAHIGPRRLFRRAQALAVELDLPHPRLATEPATVAAMMAALIAAAHDGHGPTCGLLAEAGELLAQAVGSAVNLLNPACVVLGGYLLEADELILAPFRATLPRFVMRELLDGLAIRSATLGDHAAFLGVVRVAGDSCLAATAVNHQQTGAALWPVA